MNVASHNRVHWNHHLCMEEGGGWPGGVGAAGVGTCRTSRAALILLNSAPKSPLLAFVSLRHLFLRCIAAIFFPQDGEFFPSSILNNQRSMKKVKFKCQTQKLRGFKNCLVYVSTYWKLAQTCHYQLWDITADVTEWKSLFPAKVFAGDAITRCHWAAVGKGSEQRGEREEAARAGLDSAPGSELSVPSLPTNSDSPSCPFSIPVRTL